MVVVTTRNRIRICLDPKDLTKGVIRPKYQMPTSDELLPKLSEAKVFSTLDAKDGFFRLDWMQVVASRGHSGLCLGVTSI